MLDLSVTNIPQSHEDGYEFEVLKPNGDKTGAFITVYGPESPTFLAYQRRKIKEQERKEKMLKGKNKDSAMTTDELFEVITENAVARIKTWRGIANGVDSKGKPVEVPFDADTAFEILDKNKWIRDQVVEASNDIENFRC